MDKNVHTASNGFKKLNAVLDSAESVPKVYENDFNAYCDTYCQDILQIRASFDYVEPDCHDSILFYGEIHIIFGTRHCP